MSLIKWTPFFEPFEGMEKMLEDMQSMTTRGASGIVPPIDMYETKDAVVVETPMAGVDPSKIEISVDGGLLTIKGSTERKTEVDEKNYYRKEIRSGTVFRQVALPAAVTEAKADASFEDGILKINLPKAEPKQSIKIDVKKK